MAMPQEEARELEEVIDLHGDITSHSTVFIDSQLSGQTPIIQVNKTNGMNTIHKQS